MLAVEFAEFHEDSVLLSKFSYIRGSAAIAYLFRDYEKVIIYYKDGKYDLNKKKKKKFI